MEKFFNSIGLTGFDVLFIVCLAAVVVSITIFQISLDKIDNGKN